MKEIFSLAGLQKVLDAHIGSLWDQGYDMLRKIGAQGVDYVGYFILELLRKGQITAGTYFPKLNEIAQNNSVIQNSDSSFGMQNNLDATALDDEDFDILMMENPDLYNNAIEASLKKVPEENQDSDTDSPQSEDLKSVKKRPLRVSTRNKAKVSGLRERKKKNDN